MNHLPPIIGITGYARTGKDSAAHALGGLFGYEQRAFADALRNVLYDVNPDITQNVTSSIWSLQDAVDHFGWEGAKEQFPQLRELQKGLGNGVRKHVNPNVWIAKALEQRPSLLVISDVRFVNEANAIKAFGGTIVRIHRPGVEAESEFEREVDDIFADYGVTNAGTLEDLAVAMAAAVRQYLHDQELKARAEQDEMEAAGYMSRNRITSPVGTKANDEFNAMLREARYTSEAAAGIVKLLTERDSQAGDAMAETFRSECRQHPLWPPFNRCDPVFKADL